jgi:AcrR family transcriptional regulator
MGVKERRDRDRKRRFDEIIDAAKHIFLTKGFSGTTMNDIADYSDLSRRTLYHYFKSKEEVSLASACVTLESLLEQIDFVHRAEEDGMGRLHLTLEIYKRLYEKDPGGFQFIINISEILHAVGNDNESIKQCFALIERIVKAIAGFMREGMVDGSIRQLPNPEKTAAVLVSMVHSAIQDAVTDSDFVRIATSNNSEEYLQEVFDVLNAYLLPDHP